MKLVTAFLFLAPVVSQETQVSSIWTNRELLICRNLSTKQFIYGTTEPPKRCAQVKKQLHREKFCEKMVTNISANPPKGFPLRAQGKVFCPKACWECGTPPCEDDKKASFIKKKTSITKCKQLANK